MPMNYKCFYLIACLFSFINLFSQTSKSEFRIFGIIKGLGNTKVLLGNKGVGYNDAFKLIYFDSCISYNDTFEFKGRINEPLIYSVEFPEKTNSWKYVVVENSNIFITGDIDSVGKANVFGSNEHTKFYNFRINYYLPLVKRQNIYFELRYSLNKLTDSVEWFKFNDSIKYYSGLIQKTTLGFIEKNPNYFVSLYLLNSLVNQQVSSDILKVYFKLLSKKLKNHSIGKDIEYELYKKDQTINIGKKLPKFSLQDTSGKKISSLNLRSKYTIIVFWASWCGPCIEEIPDLKRIHSFYSPKGLNILSISIDTNLFNWKAAVLQNAISWLNLSDLQGDNSPIYKMFSIDFIPKLYLINQDRKIILMETTIKDLDTYLNTIL